MSNGGVLSEDVGAIRIVTIDRPEKRNALTKSMMQALSETVDDFGSDESLSVCIITGEGEKAFCAGADLQDTINVDREGSFAADFLRHPGEYASDSYYLPYLSLHRAASHMVLIAAINGVAVGGGFEIALAADLRIATESAEFGLPEVSVGSIPALGTISRLRQALPQSWVLELLLTGERISAHRAYEIGLLSRVVPQERLIDEAMALAERIASKPPLSVRAIKFLLAFESGMSSAEAEKLDHLVWGLLSGTEDRREGREAFIEGRPPRFKGR